MNLNSRQKTFAKLGHFLREFTAEKPDFTAEEKEFSPKLQHAIFTAIQHNGWFTEEDIYFNLNQWGQNLTAKRLKTWASAYELAPSSPKTVAIIMAGNVPLVGFHDFLSVLISGHHALIKQSSKDKHLLPCLLDFMVRTAPELRNRVQFTDERLEGFDAVIATGSNNTARYFDYYFSKKPHIIRKNRTSVAVLTGEETQADLKNLGEDIFRYYGLGCRNVSKLFVPEAYEFTDFFEAIYKWHPIINSHKYANNYDYNKAVYLMSEFEFLENGFMVLKEDTKNASPIGCLFYEHYKNEADLKRLLRENEKEIQCVLSEKPGIDGLNFGTSQRPRLDDYADGVDTLAFLSSL